MTTETIATTTATTATEEMIKIWNDHQTQI